MNYVTFFSISGTSLFIWFAIAIIYLVYTEFVRKDYGINTPKFLVNLETLLLSVGVIFLLGGVIDWYLTK